MNENKNSSEELKEIRKSLNMTQKEFAKEFTCSVRTVQEWEQGRVEIKPHIMALFRKINEFSKMNGNVKTKSEKNVADLKKNEHVSAEKSREYLEIEHLNNRHQVAMFKMRESYMCCVVDKNICVEIHDTKNVEFNIELLKRLLLDEGSSKAIATAISEYDINNGGE